MLFYSTSRQSPLVDFREATVRGQAPDGGLYFPERIPEFDAAALKRLKKLKAADLGVEVLKPYVGDTIGEEALYEICAHTLNFPIPLLEVNDTISVLELFHGATLAFKDVGARFMSRCLGEFAKGSDQKITVLVATSGDTGSAVANGFLGVEGVEVIILYPSGKVSAVQELQLTTNGQNIKALEVMGTFDDCQRLVKQAFSDEEIRKELFLTSANSINVARWLPQQVYYFMAWQQWEESEPPVISVPSGNFGNIAAGLLAMKSGLPVKHFVAACNSNDVFTRYLQTGKFEAHKAQATISNAMDVGLPSNFVRILEMFGGDYDAIRKAISSYSLSDVETKEVMKRVYEQVGYLLDPHGAVGYGALEQYLRDAGGKGLFLETAHPVKFNGVVKETTGVEPELPEEMEALLKRTKQSVAMEPDYESFKTYLKKG